MRIDRKLERGEFAVEVGLRIQQRPRHPFAGARPRFTHFGREEHDCGRGRHGAQCAEPPFTFHEAEQR